MPAGQYDGAPHIVRSQQRSRGRNLGSGVLVGVGLAAFVDEAVFHQLLHWHHFYDRSTSDAALVSDGLLHAFSWFATVSGLVLFASLRRFRAVWPTAWWSGLAIGAGAFQLFDGTVHHKLLRLHQVRYGVDLTPYDLWWNVAGAIVLVAGLALLALTRRAGPAQ